MPDLEKITAPGVYDLSEEAYHADPCPAPSLSSSIGKTVISRTPRHAWVRHPRLNPKFQPENNAKFDLGKAAHTMTLGDKERFVLIEAADWRTKAAKEARDKAYADGKVPLLQEQYEQTLEMAAAAHAQLAVHEEASTAYTDGIPEQTLVWREGEIWCRCRLDWLPNEQEVFYDYKSTGTSANPETFTRTLFDLGYDFQAAFYRRGIRAVIGTAEPQFHFVVQENYPPYALSVIGLAPGYIDAAEKDVLKALDTWRWCLKNDSWPGYPNRIAYVEAPPWLEARRMEREIRDEVARESKGNEAIYSQMMDWYSPFDSREKETTE